MIKKNVAVFYLFIPLLNMFLRKLQIYNIRKCILKSVINRKQVKRNTADD